MARKGKKYGTATIIGGTAAKAANLERVVRNAPLDAEVCAAFDTPVRITVVSYRVTLADADGISAKAAIDGLVLARIIVDDSPEYLEEVRYRQVKVEKVEEEQTVLEIVSVGTSK
jgi:hypothetical protein